LKDHKQVVRGDHFVLDVVLFGSNEEFEFDMQGHAENKQMDLGYCLVLFQSLRKLGRALDEGIEWRMKD
jgi:hypothetical protein